MTLDDLGLDLAAVASPGDLVILHPTRRIPFERLQDIAIGLRYITEDTGVRFMLLDKNIRVAKITKAEGSE